MGVLKHRLNVEASYFDPTFGREFPAPEKPVPIQVYDEGSQADWYARENETKDELIGLYRCVGVFTDQTTKQPKSSHTVGSRPVSDTGHA